MLSADILITAVQQHKAIHAIWLTCHCLETIKTTDSHTLRYNNCQVYSAYFLELFNVGTVCVPKMHNQTGSALHCGHPIGVRKLLKFDPVAENDKGETH